MKRNIELILEILKQVEDNNDPERSIVATSELHDDALVQYNVNLIWQFGLIEAEKITTGEGTTYRIKSLTWSGHDFLDAARNDTVVNQAKAKAKSVGLEFAHLPLEIAKEFLTFGIKGLLGI